VNSDFVFEAIRAHLRTRGMSYKDLSAAIGLSESAVKKLFVRRDCTLSRLHDICNFIQIDLCEIARGTPRQSRLINALTREQEQEIVDDTRLFVVAVCALQGFTFEDIIAGYRISAPQCIALLARLDKIGFLELMPKNHYRLLVTKTFRWISDGPIMRWTKAHAPEYFDCVFDGPGETLRVINVRISPESRTALLSHLEELAMEYAQQHNADATLPIRERYPLSLCLAVRPWEPKEFRALRRRAEPHIDRRAKAASLVLRA
jgi:DNA-binding Xre family transcriptional regulator